MTANKLKEDESQSNACPLTELTGFQRDLLFAVVQITDRRATGVAIKTELEKYYDEEINHGRFYQNLRELTTQGFIEKQPIDGRTNVHWLTNNTHERLESHHQWEMNCLYNEYAKKSDEQS